MMMIYNKRRLRGRVLVVLLIVALCSLLTTSIIASSPSSSTSEYPFSPYPNTKVNSKQKKKPKQQQQQAKQLLQVENPFADGVNKQDVDFLVKEVMKDPDINIALIPDFIEKQLYKTTITLVLNAIYNVLGENHGRKLPAGHCLKLGRRKSNSISQARIKSYYLQAIRDDNFDYEEIDNVANRLLANPAVNSPFVPDNIEKQLYVSCLKLIFRLLAIVAASTRINLCGHEIRLKISPSTTTTTSIQQQACQSATNTATTIDTQHIKEFARDARLQSIIKKPWLFGKQRQDFMIHLHASLFGLILGIIDDLLYNTKLELLSDRVRLDVVPSDDEEMVAYQNCLLQSKVLSQLDTLSSSVSEEEVGGGRQTTTISSSTGIATLNDVVVTTPPRKNSSPRSWRKGFAFGMGTGLGVMATVQHFDTISTFVSGKLSSSIG